MLKLLKKIILVFAFIGTIILIGCDTISPKPDCELYNYGSVTVINETGIIIIVDVTWGNIDENNNVMLFDGWSHIYNKIPAGTIYCWIKRANYNWKSNNEYLTRCENLTYRWSLSSNKSTENSLILEISQNGKIIKTISEFEYKEKNN